MTRALSAALALFLVSCSRSTPPLTANEKTTIANEVRTVMSSVAADVTRDGPLAWLRYFETGPEFFMAVNGGMAFPDGAAARENTQKFATTINRIELKWEGNLRVDPLTKDLAAVASPWHEVQIDKQGHRNEESGYFTGLCERIDGAWHIRNAHWSQATGK